MVKFFCSQRHSIKLILLLAASFLRNTCLTLSRTVGWPARPKYKPSEQGLDQTRPNRAAAKRKNPQRKEESEKEVAGMSKMSRMSEPCRSRGNGRVAACLSPSRALYDAWGGESAVPPASLHPLWDMEEGKINAGGERQEELRGLCCCSERQPNQMHREEEEVEWIPPSPPLLPTATHCAIALQWTIGHMGRRKKEKGTDLFTFYYPSPDSQPPPLQKK